MSATLCIDLGGTNLRAGLIGEGSGFEPEPVGHWPSPGSVEGFRDCVDGLIAKHGASRLGVAIPGLAAVTRCVWVPNLRYLDGVELTALFSNVEVALGNDAQMALLAEAAHGAARTMSDAILLAIGTGIGSAVLSDGRILRGKNGSATSFGWACADPGDPGDDAHGWLERHAAGRALDGLAERHGLRDGSAIVAAAMAGDETAAGLLAGPADALGATLAGAVGLLGSEAIIVSGGVADGIGVLAPMVLATLRRQLPPHLRAVDMVSGEFGPRASLVGAGLAAENHPLWAGSMTGWGT